MMQHTPTPLEQLLDVALGKKSITLGLPATRTAADHRFALTPEGAAMLIDRGITVCMEPNAGQAIHYSDARYAQAGVHIVTRAEALAADLVLHLPPLNPLDAQRLRRGAVLLTMLNPTTQSPEAVQVLLDRHVVSFALDLVKDGNGNRTFADILNEIDGRAAISIASTLLADSRYGKGILLGGVAGIIPCEVTIIGAGIAGIAAARSALGMGAIVRIFDNNVYQLRCATQTLGAGVAASALHPRVLVSALRAADVVISTHIDHPHIIGADAVQLMKEGAIIFNLDKTTNVFPSLPNVDLATVSSDAVRSDVRRVNFINAAGAVPRTTAMAMSNSIVTMFDDMLSCGGEFLTALKLMPGLQCAVSTFMGRVVNAQLASSLGTRHVDINLLLQFS